MDVAFSVNAGTKYLQLVNEHTPVYVQCGYRMEDAVGVRRRRRQVHVAVSDGHGSVQLLPGRKVGGRECADHCVRLGLALSPMKPDNAELKFKRIQETHLNDAGPLLSYGQHTVTLRGNELLALTETNRLETVAHGATLSTLSVDTRAMTFHFANVGDSTGLLSRAGGYVPLGELHTRKNSAETRRVREAGARPVGNRWVDYEIAGHKYSSQITRSIGHFGNEAITQVPFTQYGDVQPGDRFVVATDGLWNHLSRGDVHRILLDANTAQNAVDALIERAIVNSDVNKRRDNIAVVCVFVPVRRRICGF